MRAWLGAGFLVEVDTCENGWCSVSADAGEDHPAVSGDMLEIELWGVYPDEVIE